ncbi:TIGR03643 family protein [Acinetobacter soli]|nr:TIGR03643 family protein [Acinetobacter soli]
MLSQQFLVNINGERVTQTREYQDDEISRIIEMAWEDRTPFEAIEREFGLNESAVIRLMRQHMKSSSFKLWRERVTGRKTKHLQLRSPDEIRGYCTRQYKHH